MLTTANLLLTEEDFQAAHEENRDLFNEPNRFITMYPRQTSGLDNPTTESAQVIPMLYPEPQTLTTDNEDSTNLSTLNGVITGLPSFFQEITNWYTTYDEKMIALYTSIVITGGTMPYIEINYSNDIHYPALMLAIIFPPASGKGAITQVKKITRKVDAELARNNTDRKKLYATELDFYENVGRKGLNPEKPEKPTEPILICPGNITSAKLIEQLASNGQDQVLVMCESEADSFGVSSTGGFSALNSTMLRQAYHHEDISQARKNDDGLIKVETPKFAVVLGGTHNQFLNIFPSNEDGLFSRFLVLYGQGAPKWRSVTPCESGPSINDRIEAMGDKYYSLWKFLDKRNVQITFTQRQWEQINEFGNEKFNHTYHFTSMQTGSLAIRHCTMIVRLAAILTMTRAFEFNNIASVIMCDDLDFNIAFWLTSKSLESSLSFFKTLPKAGDLKIGAKNAIFYNNLPDQFDTQYYHYLARSQNIAERSADRYIQDLVSSTALVRLKKGFYAKSTVGIQAAVLPPV